MEIDEDDAITPYTAIRDLFVAYSEDETQKREPGGSLPGMSGNIGRKTAARLERMDFCHNPTFDCETFRRYFRVSKTIFQKVFNAVSSYDAYFQQK